MELCPCQSQKEYKDCCEKYLTNKAKPETAEALMRARYTAFAKANIDFIEKTHVPGTEDFDKDAALEWSKNSQWKGMEVIKTSLGQKDHQKGTVEFKAIYANDKDEHFIHHEIAQFEKIKNEWFYKDGQIVGLGPITRAEPKIGRNDPCSCGSGKKFKKCCGA